MNWFFRCIMIFSMALSVTSLHCWDGTRLSVPVEVNGRIIPFPVFAIFVMPSSPISVGIVGAMGDASVRFGGQDVDFLQEELKAPEVPGLTQLEIHNPVSGETCLIHVFTLVPAERVDKNHRLNGYRMGRYPDKPLRDLDIYLPPQGFVEVSAENSGTAVSPNFTLGEFVAKQKSDYPKYLVLRSSLLMKLEDILTALNESGHQTSGLVIMSGYRTPSYNRAIGNVQYSRHVWGGAADFYIDDSPRNGRMDDLNGDGKTDRKDARWLANFIDQMSQNGVFGASIGGIGVYGSTSAHGPFVHVDVRGTRARW